ncbi:Holliday junction resolvase RuvX [Marinobacteraceae bacterium S3BR75-40.1]
MAFDFGVRWIGVAAGQTLTGTGSPVARLNARDGIPDWEEIGGLLKEWRPSRLVVGLPLNMDGSESDMATRARKFAKRLHGRYHLPVDLVDERLTSHEAKQQARDAGHGGDFGTAGIDDRAAVLILESWFAQHAG